MTHLDPETGRFLADLKRNNDRAWFQDNRPRYEAARADFESFIAALLPRIEAFDPAVAGLDPGKCVFRIYRDTRFSKDKTPYKTNLGAHMLMGGGGNVHQRAGYYIQVEPGNCFLAGGAHQPPSAWINAIRRRIDADPEPLKKLLKSKPFRDAFGGIEGERLKTAPKGYPKDHPDIDLLRCKSFLAVHKLRDELVFSGDLLKHAAKTFKTLKPFDDYLNGAMEDHA